MLTGYKLRIYLLTALVLCGLGVLFQRLYEYQIQRRYEFLNLMPQNREVKVREPGIRGEIKDRNGLLLARNLRKYEVSFNIDEIREAYVAKTAEEAGLENKARKNELRANAGTADIVKIVNERIIERLKSLGLAKNYNANALRVHAKTHGGLVPFSYRADLTYDEFARFAEHCHDLPGVNLSMCPQRDYPYGALASHVLGYLQQWEKGDINSQNGEKFDHYVGDVKGIAGIEASLDEVLKGAEGTKTVVKNEKGRTIRMTDYTVPGRGADVQLTIDAHKQYLLENVLRKAGRAAGVIMDVNTGEVIAMASVPDYDPNAFIPSIKKQRLQGYSSNKLLTPLNNRAIAAYAPGSTMKVPTAIAGALQGMATKSFSCDGFVSYGSHNVGCWIWNKSKGMHGTLNLPRALQQSCNPYFNKLANAIGSKAMVEGFEMVGLGKKTGIELPAEKPGILPGSKAWKAANPSAVMTPALGAFVSIGQGDMMATPLQLCAMTSCVANGGKYYQPRLVRKAVNQEGETVIEDKPKMITDLIQSGVKKEDLDLIRKGMWMAVNEPGGTAGRVKMNGIEVAAKTGTAQTIEAGQKSNNSWVMSFAPFSQPKYAVCVLVQHAGSGGGVCGPLVNMIYTGLYAQEQGARMPLTKQGEYAGHTQRIEAIEPPKDVLAEVLGVAPGEANLTAGLPKIEAANHGEVIGENGDEAGDLDVPVAIPVDDAPLLKPTVTPDVDSEGTVIPNAIPIDE